MGEHHEAFGSFLVRADLGTGRVGPVFLGHDPATDRSVVIRVFDAPFTEDQRHAVVAALDALCATPLDHPSIAKPLGCGLEQGRPYVVHAALEGIPAQARLAERGPQAMHDVVLQMTPIAGAIDFAAAAGVHHGALSLSDVVIDGDHAAISGFGLIQALGAANGRDRMPTHADDVRALAGMVFELTHGRPYGAAADAPSQHRAVDDTRARRVFDAVLAPDAVRPPASALALIAALQGDEDGRAREPQASLSIPDDPPIAQPPVESVDPLPLVTSEMPPPRSQGLLVEATPAPRGSSWGVVATALCIGVLIGLGGGVLVGRRIADVAIPAAVHGPLPEATSGIGDTRAPVDTAPAEPLPEIVAPPVPVVPTPSVPSGAPGEGSRRTRGESTATSRLSSQRAPEATASRTGEVEVVSHPAGADVFIDGRVVGRTPMVIGAISAGRHSIRLHLPGHHEWATTMAVEGGARTRVAASLEE